ncbi:MAG: YgjP-like metallopeptidase domain-containing protein [Candidatus Altiarchaeota archaeon]
MKEILVFGNSVKIKEIPSNFEKVQMKGNILSVYGNKTLANSLIEQFLSDLLLFELEKILSKTIKQDEIELFGNLDFKIVKKIDGRSRRVAKLKGNKIIVKLSAVSLPKSVLKYILLHEIVHTLSKKHGVKFTKLMKAIDSDYQKNERILKEFEDILINWGR